MSELSEGQEIVDELASMAREGKSHGDCLAYFENQCRRDSANPVNFDYVKVVKQNWSKFKLSGLSFCHARFEGCELYATDFSRCELQDAVFDKWHRDQSLTGGSLSISQVYLTVAIGADFTNAVADRAAFHCNLAKSKFHGTHLDRCDFSRSQLQNTDFIEANLTGAMLRGAAVNSGTRFERIDRIQGATIDRYSLACLGPDFGGLTEGNRINMTIIDDVAELRGAFGGLWGVLHLVAMVVFLAPYVRFLAINWAKAKFATGRDETISLFEALLRYIVTGGVNWQHSWMPNIWSLVPFLVYLVYNVARGALLWKTKKLETQQEVSGLPVRFSLADSTLWYRCYAFVQWAFYFAIAAVVINTLHFLSMRIPIN